MLQVIIIIILVCHKYNKVLLTVNDDITTAKIIVKPIIYVECIYCSDFTSKSPFNFSTILEDPK